MEPTDLAAKIINDRYNDPIYVQNIEDAIKEAAHADTPEKTYGLTDKFHGPYVLRWVEKLFEGKVPDALRLAALGHDWDRSWKEERDPLEWYPHEGKKPVPEWYDAHKQMHAANSARLLRRELSDVLPESMMQDIVYMVIYHELGGRIDENGALIETMDQHTGSYNLNEALDILQKADSLAFFDILDIYVDKKGPDKAKQKIRFMYDRIKDPAIQSMIQDLQYEFKNPRAVDVFKEALILS